MGSVTKMIVDDPSKFNLLTADMKEKIIEGGINTVNVMAALARKEAIKNIKSSFTTRNTFTTRQVGFTPMPKGRCSLKEIHSIVGITTKAPYMKRQEEGGEHTPAKGSKLAIPTDEARGGDKKRPVKKRFRVGNIKKKHRVHGDPRPYTRKSNGKKIEVKAKTYKSNSARLVARAAVAHKKALLLPWGGSDTERNLHWVKKFDPKAKKPFETKQVYNFSHYKTHTKARKWLEPACEKVSRDAQKIFNSEMKKLGM
jgi:hypothetical protein